jgi:hypothetical protein
MVKIKAMDIPHFPPAYREAYCEEQGTITVEQKDWDEYISVLRQYTSAYCKLAEKIERNNQVE